MSKTSIILGLMLSVGLHGLIFWPQLRNMDLLSERPESQEPAPAPSEQQRVAVQVRPVPAPQPSEATTPPQPPVAPTSHTPEPATPPPPERVSEPQPELQDELQHLVAAAPPAPPPADEDPEPLAVTEPLSESAAALQAVIEPRNAAAPVAPTASDDAAPEQEAALPTLRIEWRSARQLKNVARVLGLRIIAVDATNDIVGEISMMGSPALVSFEGQLSSYSNRVRTLARDYFGPADRWPGGDAIAALWILVPADLDQRLAETQRDAIREAGRTPQDIKVTVGRFEAYGDSYRLIITRMI